MSEKKYTEEELTEAVRGGIEDRATWFYLLLKVAKEEGLDPDKVSKQAITEYGKLKSKNFKNVNGADDFVDQLAGGVTKLAFGAKKIVSEEKRTEIKFSHCPLVEAWKKLGCSNEEIVDLCKMANYGDLGIVSRFPELQIEFPKMISKGDSFCHVVVTKR